MYTGTFVSGLLALMWLLLRSGTKPSRLTHPCQQAALGTVAATFGAPFLATVVAMRLRASALLRTTAGKVAGGGVAALGMVMLVVAVGYTEYKAQLLDPSPDYHPDVYLVNDARGNEPEIDPERFGGVDDLITLMGENGLKWHRSATTTTTSGPNGMIDADDVILIKINGQWAERGGTNTDVLRGVMRRIVEHPDGFVGEIVVADNGQGSGGLDRSEHNAEDHGQSTLDVVNEFVGEGWNTSARLWDGLRSNAVDEYSTGDMTDG
jgi:hypothetical protein